MDLNRFRTLLDHVVEAIFVVEISSGIIVDVSGSAREMLNCCGESLVGLSFYEMLPSYVARYTDNLFQANSGTLYIETELRCPACDQELMKVVEMSVSLEQGDSASLAMVIARDISERKRNEALLQSNHDKLEIRVQERTRELEQANKAKTEFLSIVSHELRTPLTSVVGFADIIYKKFKQSIVPALTDVDDPKIAKDIRQIRENLGIIVTEGDRLTMLINDVLDLAKLEANRVQYRMVPIRPEDFIYRSVDATSVLFKQAQLAFVLEVEPDLPEISGDLDRLIQVMVNLFSNAVKFTRKGNVTCRVSLLDDHLRVSVTDTGMGIPEKMRATLFEKFTQGEDTLSDRQKGTGLGLAICKHIVEGHCGHIWVESDYGHGSKFVFTLPVL